MSTQGVPRHRAASAPSNTPTGALGAASAHRTTLVLAGTVFVALFVVALATLPGHSRSESGRAGPPRNLAALDDSARYATEPSAIAPPASITRGPGKRGETVGAVPPLGAGAPPPGQPSSGSSSPPVPPGTSVPSTPPAGGPPTVPSSGPTSGPGSPSATSLPDPNQVAHAVFAAINASRRDAGLRPLVWSPKLQTSAEQHNQAMARSNTLSHQTPGEDDLGTRESDAGVPWWWAGENIARTSTMTEQAALDLEAAMVNEQPPNDGHRQNILAGNADEAGVSVLFDTEHHTLWLTEDFAQTSLI